MRFWECLACQGQNGYKAGWCMHCGAPLVPGTYEEYDSTDAPPPEYEEPPEFRYIGVQMGSHGGVAHVAPDCPPETLAALDALMDAAYDQAVRERPD